MKKLFLLLIFLECAAASWAGSWTSWTKEQHLPGPIHAMAKEKNNLWLGTDKGLALFHTDTNTIDQIAAVATPVHSMLQHQQSLWLGTQQGVVEWRLDKRKATPMPASAGWPKAPVTSLCLGGGSLWVGTNDGLYRYEYLLKRIKPYPLDANAKTPSVSSLFWAHGQLQVGLSNMDIHVLDPESGEWEVLEQEGTRHRPVVILPWKTMVVMGTNGGGLRLYDTITAQWNAKTTRHGLSDDFVQTMTLDGRHLWIGTFDQLCQYNLETKAWKTFSTKDGLSDDSVTALLVDGSHLWVGTESGLSRYEKNTPETSLNLSNTRLTDTQEPIELEGRTASSLGMGSVQLDYCTLSFQKIWHTKGIKLIEGLKGGPLKAEWSLDQLPSANETYLLRLRATDSQGNSNESIVPVCLDAVMPQITLDPLDTPVVIGLETITGTFNKSEVQSVIVSPGQVQAEVHKNQRTFKAVVELKSGKNTVSAHLKDRFGREAVAELDVIAQEELHAKKSLLVNKEKDSDSSRITLNEMLLFDLGSAEIEPAGRAALDKIASVLKQRSGWTARIEGHTDNTPIVRNRYRSNQELSEARAQSVYRHFVQAGLAVERLTIKGYGSNKPIVPNDQPQDRAKNRRVEILLVPKTERNP